MCNALKQTSPTPVYMSMFVGLFIFKGVSSLILDRYKNSCHKNDWSNINILDDKFVCF